MNRILLSLMLILFVGAGAQAQKAAKKDKPKMPTECRKCHSCDQPTKANPCLDPCPRQELFTVHQKDGVGPNSITMSVLSPEKRMYPPVVFSHRAHAEMSDLAGGCKMCHHNNTAILILPCRSCHEPTHKRTDISIPELKGAYHRQCMDCHKSWSHNVSCSQCHAGQKTPAQIDEKRQHPVITEPVKVVKTTSYKDGKLVTFNHSQHTRMFGLECQSCHTNESCVRCHDKDKKNVRVARTLEQKHAVCSKCHATQTNCGFCHGDTPKPAFDHARRTGWTLNRFHAKLDCNSCHKTAGKFAGLTRDCGTCHKSWTASGFNHVKTGFKLDKNHATFECTECHAKSNYTEKSCKNCHDDKSWPNDKPGQAVSYSPKRKSK